MNAKPPPPLLFVAALLALGAIACGNASKTSASSSPSASPAATNSTPAPADSVRPLTAKELPTTSGKIATGNLEGSLAAADKKLSAHPDDPTAILAVYGFLAQQQPFTSSVAALKRLLELAEKLVAVAPKESRSFLTRAAARAGVHRFALAKEDLATAASLGAHDDELDPLRASILQAEGDLDGALALRHKLTLARPTIATRTTEAVLLAELGRMDEATQLFDEAARKYNDVSAFPVAWLYFQEGAVWERARNLPRAKAFYQAAYERLPIYAHAASHYALLEKTDKAIEILEPVLAITDDPEFEWAFAQVLRKHGRAADADVHLAKARARYDAICAELPEAYAEHAATFWLADGKDPDKALVWAKTNLEVRRSSFAYETALLAAIASKSTADGCVFRKGAEALPHPPEILLALAKDACPTP